MKSFIDILSVILASRSMLDGSVGDGRSSSSSRFVEGECDSAYATFNQTCASSSSPPEEVKVVPSHPAAPRLRDGRRTRTATSSPRAPPTQAIFPDSPNQEHDESPDAHLKIGSLVELYGDNSHFANPAIITGQKTSSIEDDDESFIKYSLHEVIHNSNPSNVDPIFIHPYRVYEDGTEASCNIGGLRKMYMIPCKVVDKSIKKTSGFVSYQIEYENEADGQMRQMWMPFSKVQRVQKKVHVFEA